MTGRRAILHAARAWIGTPYRAGASLRGAGCDCAGLIRGIWRECVGPEPPWPSAPPDPVGDVLLAGARSWLVEIDDATAQPGDVLLFRPDLSAPPRHCALLSAPDRLLHAWARRAVCETALTPWWRRRCAAAFAFPPPISTPPNPADPSSGD